MKNNGGNNSDAEDVFQDALIAFYERVRSDEFTIKKSIGAYLYQISKYVWINKFKRGLRMKYTNEDEKLDGVDTSFGDEALLFDEKQSFVKKLLNQLGEDCQKVLTMALVDERDMSYISLKMNYASAQIARNKKYKCLEQLKRIVKKSVGLTKWSDEFRGE